MSRSTRCDASHHIAVAESSGCRLLVPPAACSGKEHMRHSSMRRAGALLASGAVTLAGLTLAAPGTASAAEPVPTSPVQGGAQWLRSQLTGGVVHNQTYDFDDLGLTVDFGLAFDAIGEDDGLDAIATTLAEPANLNSYISFEDSNFAGSTAKALVLAQAAGRDGHSFGGVDLVARLESMVGTSGATTGRIADQSSFGDYANVLGQSYAVQALDEAGSDSADDATDFLIAQQCTAGYFRVGFSDPADADQSCDGATDAPADVDATAVALLALLPQAGDPAVADDVDQAVDWLVARQGEDGSFGGGVSTEGANTNSTGLAGWALGLAG